MNFYKNKIVWVTGASSGIGAALVKNLANQGSKLIISSRNRQSLQVIKDSCENSANITVVPLDLEKGHEIEKIATELFKTVDHIDILINNGGISQRSLIKETKMEVYHKLMNINFFGTVALTKEVLPNMIRNQAGHIVVISSLMGKFSSKFRSGYAAAKHALHGFFESLRLEHYEDNIKVLMVCPGFIKTNISKNSVTKDGKLHNKMDKSQEQGLSPEECAKQILRALEKGKEEVYIGGKEISTLYLKRFFPALLKKILKNRSEA